MTKKAKWIVGICAAVVAILIAVIVPLSVSSVKSSNAAKDAANSQALREQAYEEVKDIPQNSIEDKIKVRLIKAWADWQPDYEGWIEWSNSLYASNAVIDAIGGEQAFADYQKSMKTQREKSKMAMGPIWDDMSITGYVATLHYHMYLTSGNKTQDVIVTEINTFQEIDGVLMVVRLDLSTKRAK